MAARAAVLAVLAVRGALLAVPSPTARPAPHKAFASILGCVGSVGGANDDQRQEHSNTRARRGRGAVQPFALLNTLARCRTVTPCEACARARSPPAADRYACKKSRVLPAPFPYGPKRPRFRDSRSPAPFLYTPLTLPLLGRTE